MPFSQCLFSLEYSRQFVHYKQTFPAKSDQLLIDTAVDRYIAIVWPLKTRTSYLKTSKCMCHASHVTCVNVTTEKSALQFLTITSERLVCKDASTVFKLCKSGPQSCQKELVHSGSISRIRWKSTWGWKKLRREWTRRNTWETFMVRQTCPCNSSRTKLYAVR